MEAVNLLPLYARPGRRWTTAGKDIAPARVLTIGGVVAAAAAIAVGGLYFHERSLVSNRHAELADAQSRLAAAEATAAPLRAAAAGNEARIAVVRTVSDSRVAWETIMRDVARVMPDQAYLQSMNVQNGVSTDPAAATPGTFTVNGAASSHVRVALVLDRLALLPWLTNITLASSTRGSSGAGQASSDAFSINATFTRPGGSQ
jgi:Tfp pilus assembly protein PilN